jgi:hypothetical protein
MLRVILRVVLEEFTQDEARRIWAVQQLQILIDSDEYVRLQASIGANGLLTSSLDRFQTLKSKQAVYVLWHLDNVLFTMETVSEADPFTSIVMSLLKIVLRLHPLSLLIPGIPGRSCLRSFPLVV